MLKEAGMLEKTQIYATDINPYVVEEAKNGMYPLGTLDKDIANYRNALGENSFVQYFDINRSYIKVKDELKKNILFFQHSLLSKGTLNEFNLIMCRNVFIYFNDSLQEKVLKSFYNSLDNNGFLVLGKSEGILKNGGQKYFSVYDEKNKILKRA
jgi:chemotaxis protein methyltransferase CheR